MSFSGTFPALTVMMVAYAGEFVGLIAVSDVLREEAASMIAQARIVSEEGFGRSGDGSCAG